MLTAIFEGLRSFALDGIKKVILLNKKADEVPEKALHENFAESYGIFSGKATQRAKLKFDLQPGFTRFPRE